MWFGITSLTITPNSQLSFLIEPLNGILDGLETNLGKLTDLSPDNSELKSILEPIESSLQDIISNIKSL